MDIEIITVNFLPNGDIEVVYKKHGANQTATIPAKSALRKAMDSILIEKIKSALSLPG